MKFSKETKKVIGVTCLCLFCLGGGFNPSIYLETFLPPEMFRSVIAKEWLKTVAFIIMICVFDPIEVKGKSRKDYLMIVFFVIAMFYMCFSYMKRV